MENYFMQQMLKELMEDKISKEKLKIQKIQ